MQRKKVTSKMENSITTAQLAALLGLRPRTVAAWRLMDQGPPYFKSGRLIRYSLAEIQKWLGTWKRYAR